MTSLTLDPGFEPRFGDADMAEMRKLRAALGADIVYRADDLPKRAAFPEIAVVLAAHGELARIQEIEEKYGSGEILFVSATGEDDIWNAREMKEWLVEFEGSFEEIKREKWLPPLYHSLLGIGRVDEYPHAGGRAPALWGGMG